MKLSLHLEHPLLFVLDDAIPPERCEECIELASRRIAPQVIAVTDDAAGTSTQKSKYPVGPSRITPLSDAGKAEQATLHKLLQDIHSLVDVMLQTDSAENADFETPPNIHYTEPSAAAGLTLGLHVDTNMKPDRFATALLYLRDVPAGGGGETIFPLAAGESSSSQEAAEPSADPLADAAAQALLDGGCTHTRRLPRPEMAPDAKRLCAAAQQQQQHALGGATTPSANGLTTLPGRGVVVQPRAGRLVLFFTKSDSGEVDARSWHGGADVTHPGGKWTLQFFKEAPRGVDCIDDVAAYVSERRKALAARFGLGSREPGAC